MFTEGNDYTFSEIKKSLEVKEGSSMLKKGKIFVAICLEDGINFISPNLMLVKNGTLIRKIGRELSGTKYPIKLFLKNSQSSMYQYLGETTVLKSTTAPTKVGSNLQQFQGVNPKEISRLIHLHIPNPSFQRIAYGAR